LATQPTRVDRLSDVVSQGPGNPGRISGVVLLDKPPTLTSNAAVQQVRRMFDRAKAGHTGTLDPLASGLLPICLGEATKFSHPLLESSKTYRASLRLGWRSSTGDAEGELSAGVPPDFDDARLHLAVKALTGEIDQLPPMYSAVKVNGRPLYSLARKGISVERATRRVHILEFEATRQSTETLEISVRCSKGTYIRTLAEDLGDRLGCGAYLTGLRRMAIGSIEVSEAVGLEALDRMPLAGRLAVLRPIDLLLGDMPEVRLTLSDSTRLGHGLRVFGLDNIAPGQVRVYSEQGDFLGLGEISSDGSLKPKRLVSSAP